MADEVLDSPSDLVYCWPLGTDGPLAIELQLDHLCSSTAFYRSSITFN